MKKSKFKYQRRTYDEMKGLSARGSLFDSWILPEFKAYKIKPGKNRIRIFPKMWEGGPNHYGLRVFVHEGVGPDNSSYLCLKRMGKGPCPICEAHAEAVEQAENEAEEAAANKLRSREKTLMWIIDRNAEDDGPLLFRCPISLDNNIINLSLDEDTSSVIEIDDIEKGNDVRFEKEGEGLKTKYEGSKIRILPPSPLAGDDENPNEELMNEWVSFVEDHPLPECLRFYSYEHIADVFGGSKPSKRTDEDEEEETEKLPWKEKPKKAIPSKDKDASDEVIDDDEDDTEPAPKRTSPKSKPNKKPKFDEDDEPDDDEPDDDDESGEASDENVQSRAAAMRKRLAAIKGRKAD